MTKEGTWTVGKSVKRILILWILLELKCGCDKWLIPFSLKTFFVLYLLFWNQIFTWLWLKPVSAAICFRSCGFKYCFMRNIFSSSKVCALENRILRLVFFFFVLTSPSEVSPTSMSVFSDSLSSSSDDDSTLSWINLSVEFSSFSIVLLVTTSFETFSFSEKN